mgnify:CR=1 FL=1
MERDLKKMEERLEAFEKMLSFIQKNHDDTVMKMEALREEGKVRTATYGQLKNGRYNIKKTAERCYLAKRWKR